MMGSKPFFQWLQSFLGSSKELDRNGTGIDAIATGTGTGGLGTDTATTTESPFEKDFLEAIVQRRTASRSIPKNLNGILMKFPRIDRALLQIKQEFDSLDANKSNTICKTEMKACLAKLQVDLTEEDEAEIYKLSDMDQSGELGFKEFILALAFIYLRETHGPEGSSQKPLGSHIGLPAVEQAFETIVDAFFFFDKDMDGVLNKEEVQRTFGSSLQHCGEGSKLHSASGRFREMDYDSNGNCTFKEFLFAFVGWVGTAEDDDDADEDQDGGGQ